MKKIKCCRHAGILLIIKTNRIKKDGKIRKQRRERICGRYSAKVGTVREENRDRNVKFHDFLLLVFGLKRQDYIYEGISIFK